MNKVIFISGMMRSGTTLLQKSLNFHPEITISYQNKTCHFLDTIKAFHKEKNINRYHLLHHYANNNDYTLNELTTWLSENAELSSLLPSDTPLQKSGVKEVLAEEFIPYFLTKNVKCIIIVRDPRDVIASMSFGNGKEHTGTERPVLFDIRNWRKSILISEAFKNDPNLKTIKMEDLLKKPEETMRELYSFLEVSHVDFDELLMLMSSSNWKSNSSFGIKKPFDQSAIGNYKAILPVSVMKYIELTCHHEMKAMGYHVDNSDFDNEILLSFRDPFTIKRKEFEPNYSSSCDNVEYETQRMMLTPSELISRELGL